MHRFENFYMNDIVLRGKAVMGDHMLNNKEILTSILKTSQMGQTGIRSLLNVKMDASLRRDLRSQLQEYASIESQAQSIAARRGWHPRSLDPAMEFLAGRMTRMKLTGNKTDSRIADMMIQGNTQGMVKSLRDIHRYAGSDQQVCNLSQKLLNCETANIRQMQDYL